MDTSRITCGHCSVTMHIWILLTVIMLSSCVTGQTNSEPWLVEECTKWKGAIDKITQTSSVTCNTNHLCTGVACKANYTMQDLTSVSFGVEFLACEKPMKLHVNFYISGVPFSQNLDLPSTPTYYNISIPANSLLVQGSVEMSGTLDIYLTPVTGTGHVTFEMNATITGKFQGGKMYNEHIRLIPTTDAAMPQCSNKAGGLQASGLQLTGSTTPRPGPATLEPANCTRSRDTGKTCNDTSVVHQCGDHQTCTAGSPPKCHCFPDYYWDGSQCRSDSDGCNPAHDSGSNGLIIALVCFGVAVALGCLIAILRCRYVRHRQRYAQHELLINREADDPQLSDDNDPPMIEA